MDAPASVFANIAIDPEKPIPYHTQVYETLEKLIIENQLHVGERLPGEPRLGALFGVSRPVIRQALDQLLRDGLITRVMGKGTFVTGPKIRESLVGSLTGFYEDMVRQGLTPISKTLKQERVPATEKIAAHLELPVGTRVIEIRRLRFINGTPIQLVSSYLPAHLCPAVLQADFTAQSLYAYLKNECGVQIARGKRTIEAVLANKEEAKLLDIPLGAPLILLDSVSYLDDGTPIEYYHAVHRSDRVRFEVDLMRMNG